MEQEPNYKSKLMAATEITFLDNISIRPHPKYQVMYERLYNICSYVCGHTHTHTYTHTHTRTHTKRYDC